MNKNFLTRIISFVLAAMMILTSLPINTFAEPVANGNQTDSKFEIKYDNGSIVRKEDYINETKNLPVVPKKTENAKKFVANPDMPKLYTVHSDFKVQRGDDLVISFQPYIATAGDDVYEYTDQNGDKQKVLSYTEKSRIKKHITFPKLDGYTSATPNGGADITYDFIKNRAKKHELVGAEFKGHYDYIYTPITSKVNVKHLFQDINDFNKYDKKLGEENKDYKITTQHGVTGTSLTIQPLPYNEIIGYVPESTNITTQVPENPDNFEIELRYNLAHYTINYDTAGGTEIPARTLYYGQVIPKIADAEIPTKVGGDFLGWKPSVDLNTKDGKTYKANEIIAVGTDSAIKDLDANLIMPASKVTFTAVWKDKEKADYAVQFWAEKADHADGAPVADKYDYIGTRVYKDQNTGSRPDLDNEPVKDIVFPDLDQARLNKIWANANFNRGHDLYLNKFFVYNKDLTRKLNADPANGNLVKSVDSTGKTVYNIYYDRQVYDLYFTKSNAQPDKNTIYPQIWGYDKAKGEAVMKGGPGNPYHFKARFNEMMYKWPNDAKQTKGFTPGYQSFGWGPNYTTPNWPTHLDTPPYRLNAGEFLDMDNYTSWGGYTKHIDKGDGTTIDLEPIDFTTLSFGIKQDHPSIPHHMDFWMDGFKDGETIIRYDLVRTKADTGSTTYGHKYPIVTGFTPYGYDPKKQWPSIAEGSEENGRVNEEEINDLNDERDEITPNTSGTYYNNQGIQLPIGQLDFIPVFYSNQDDYGDPIDGGKAFTENGYLQFKYTRNKYPLRFNYDSSIIRDDSYFNDTNQLETFYEFPLKVLSPDLVDDDLERDDKEYFKEEPKNLLDNPENLQKLGLTDLVFNDANDGNKLKVKRPEGLSDQMVFKGWALDPAGTKLIWQNKGETMPFHPLNLYAKWGEPDYKWKVTFDPDGGVLGNIKEENLTQKRKTIQEGDIGKEEKNTYAKKEANEGEKQIFTVIQRQKLVEPKFKPTRKGYDFMGWEFVRYEKDDKGNDTKTVDTSYRDTYHLPELYSFGNDVVSNVHLKAIWVKNDIVDIKAYHHFLDLNFNEEKVVEQTLPNRRAGSYTAAVGSMQGTDYLLVPKDEWPKLEERSQLYRDYKNLTSTLNPVGRTNTYTQVLRVEPAEIKNSTTGKYEANPEAKVNVFHFYYRPFRKREYTVNYIDERGKEEIEKFFRDLKLEDINNLEKLRELSENENFKKLTEEEQKEEIEKFFRDLKLEDINNLKELRELLEDEEFKKLTEEEQEEKKEEIILDAIKRNKTKFEDKKKKADFEKIIKKYQVIGPEVVINGNRDYDARNYRKIAGWKLTSDPQQQLFFNVGKDNEFLGINGTGADQVFFYYKDVRVIEVPKDGETPDGYVRITFKADKGGSFGKDAEGKDITELHYDVIKGLKSQLLPIPKELGTKADGTPNDKVEGKYYITPETGKKFTKWDKSPLLNKDTIINEAYTFTAYFDWEGLSATGVVRTEAFKDPNGTWTNDFAPTIDQLKKQLVWREKDEVKDFPEGTVIKLYDEVGAELTTDDQVYDLVNEKKAADKDELVRTVNVKAKVTFKDGKEPQELDIPIIVYKNVYEALNENGDKPLFLKEAEGKDAKDGGLKDVTGNYVKVTVAPTGDLSNKDNKVYYVNPKAWVEIPELKLTDKEKTDLAFTHWSADKAAQNENQEDNGTYDFTKRHKFTENTIISPDFSDDVIPANQDGSKPDGTPQNFVKVTIKTTDKASDDTAYEKVFWVNPAKEVRLPAKKPTGKDVAVSNATPKAFTWVFTKWTSNESPSRAWGEDIDTGIRAKFDKETIITANYDKSIHEQGTVVAEEIEAYESTKGINDFIPTEDALKAQVKVIDASGTAAKLPSDAKLELVLGDKSQNEKYASLEEELYDKLKEKDNANDEPTRIEKVKAKVTFKNGEVQEVEIPIKVIKNIYEAKTLAEKPYYVPKEYVRVVLNPTSLATDPQKTYFYVNPQAKVVIPGNNPKGVGDSKFIKWTMKADNASVKGADYTLSERHQFTEASTITAQYSADVVPQEGNTKPEGVPDNFVEVKFVPTDKAQDTTEKIYWVNPAVDVKIPVENPKGTQYYTFKEWKIGDVTTGETYTVGTPKKFETATTITATYTEAANIIPYNPSAIDPMARPEGYVRVTFAADPGLSLTEQKAYYVKKNAGIKLGNEELVKPKYTVETGYKDDKWDKEDTLEITDQDVLVTAKAKVLPDFDTVNHPGYKKVTFVADTNGEIKENGNKVDEKVYYVNPKKFVKLSTPTPVGNTGYDFVAWSSDKVTGDFSIANYINYTEDTVITAKFNQKDAVYPKLDGTTKPDGYVEVTFKVTGTDGKIADNEVTTYYVDPSREVSLKAPKTIAGTGSMFDGWRFEDNTTAQTINPADKKQYKVDTTIYGSFKALDDIIPAVNDDGTQNLQPNEYVAVIFLQGEHAKSMKGNAIFYVNPKAGKTIGDINLQPKIKPDTGWKYTGWDKADTTEIKDYIFVLAQYEEIADVIPALKDDGTSNKKPDGYVTVTFTADNNGKLQEKGVDIQEKVYYVNPNKYVKLTAPTPVGKNNFVFGSWKSNGSVFSLDNFVKYENNTTITANFNKEKTVIPKTKPDGTENVKPANFVTVTFEIEGQGGKIADGKISVYYVDSSAEVTIHPPKTKADTGYEFEKWSIDTTEAKKYTTDTTVKGSFKNLDDIIKSKEKNGAINAKPEGYVTVQYLKGDHGVLDGQTTFYVNPKAGKTLADIEKILELTILPNPTYKFANWDKPDTTVIDRPLNVTAEYTQLPNIIKAGPTDTAPAGYVVIIFETDGNGTITGNALYEDSTNPATNETEIVYFVNPKMGVTLADATATASQTVLPVPSTTPDNPTKYKFDQWRKDIDTTSPIIRGRVHIAMFKPKEVKLTYEANGAEGNPPAELEVNYNTNVRLAGQGNLKKKDAKFLGWKIGNDINLKQAGDEIILTKDTIAVAQWKDEDNIIQYNPEDPITRPKGYVRVVFAADDGLSLSNVNYYYVKADKRLTLKAIKDDIASYGYPVVSAKTGYKFDQWNKEDTLEIDSDITVIALSTPLADTIVKVDENTEKPSNYVEVKFVAGANGTVEEKTYFVNPNKHVTLTPPTAKGNTGYEFGSWSQDATIPTVYTKNPTIIKASFNGLKDVIPKINPDGTENTQPDGYKTVTFVIDPATGGKIADEEVTVYYVNPAKEVTVKQPRTQAETGYEFEKWDTDTTVANKYTENTTVKGNFKKLKDIIPSTDGNGNPNAKPEGYVTVTFEKGEHGTKIEEQTIYYVNPKANKTIGDTKIVKPTVTPETGYKADGWDKEDSQPITGDLTVTAKYKELDDVIPKTTNDESEKPDDYITVTFDKGANGELEGNTIFYVNPNKAVVLEDKAPTIKPNTGYTSGGWDTTINKAIQYKGGDKITALYNELGDVIPQEKTDGSDKPAGYLTVTFDKGANGELTGKTVYYVKPNKEVTVPAPTVKANIGYEFEKWDKALTQTFTEDTKITAGYKALDDIIPQKKTDGLDKPDGYKIVKFVGKNGTLSVTTVYYVNPEKEVDFTNIVNGFTKTPDFAYTEVGGTWDSNEFKKTFTAVETTFTFNFVKLDNVIPENNDDGTKNTQPKGYVKVTLIPTDKATDAKNIVYYVNPKAEVTITNTPMGKEISDANGNSYSYKFIGWTVTRGTIDSWNGGNINGKFIQDTAITAKYEIEWLNIINEPVPKDDVVTAKDDVPKPENLIKNIPGTSDKPLPDGTTFRYKNGKKPDLSNPGNTTVEVEVTYPSGATTIVEVPITVVDNVVPQIGTYKPLVPGTYVKVTVDTTETATPNTRFVKVFWVKPGVEVTLPDILAPTGKTVTNLKTRVTNTNNFIKWKLVGSNPEKFYENDILDTFTAKVSRIIAVYEFNKNVEPQGKDGQWIPQGSTPDPKDFINNPYNDGDPNNKVNLPPGTSFEFVPGFKPDTETPGTDKTTKIKVTYPNGEVEEVPVTYNVSGDVVEQTDPNKKPDVPDYFVRVVVDTTDKATNVYEKVYWVNPNKIVKIPADKPEGTKDEEDHRMWLFDYWQVELQSGDGTKYRDVIEDLFTKDTHIKAYYYKAKEPGSDYVVTDLNKLPTKEEYLERIKKPTDPDKKIDDIRIVEEPDVKTPGRTYAIVDVLYSDGTSARIKVQVYVLKPGETNTQIIYRDRIVEKEKIVEKIIKIKDNQRLKEVRFMQGFEGKFRPHDGLTRAEAAQILANALKQDGYKYNPAYPINYKDVKQKWYTQAIVITTQANVFKGYDDGYFRPEEKISRAEWIATLKRFQQLKDADGNRMGLKANHWATREVEAAYEEGWLQIYTNGNAKFNANEPITREEVAAVTNKAFGRLIDRTYIMRNDKSVINYKDINPSMWSYVDILCASNSFIHDENVYMSHGIEYIKTIVNNIEGTIIFNVQLKNLEIIQDKFQRYLR